MMAKRFGSEIDMRLKKKMNQNASIKLRMRRQYIYSAL